MARPVTFTAPLHEPSQEFVDKLEAAPRLHAEALLDVYELVQQLHRSGVFSVLQGALAAGDKLATAATGAIDSPQTIAGLRNLIVLAQALAGLDPGVTRGLARAVDETMTANAVPGEPPSLWALFGHFRQPDVRRGIALVNRFLGALGRAFPPAQASRNQTSRAA